MKKVVNKQLDITFNDLPAKVIKALELKKGETKVFEVLDKRPDPNNKGKFIMPEFSVKPTQVINIEGKDYSIASVDAVQPDGNILYRKLRFLRGQDGLVAIIGGIPGAQDDYEFLMLCNENASNPYRDPNVPAKFKLLDPLKDAKVKTTGAQTRLMAMKLVEEMTDSEVRTFVYSIGGDGDEPIEVLRAQLFDMAEKDTNRFLANNSSNQKEMTATISRAIKEGVIIWDKEQHEFRWPVNNDVIATIPRSSGMKHIESLVKWLVTDRKGEAIYKEIQSLLEKKEK